MNRIGVSAKKLIIVVDDKTSTYGELLSALITMKDDKVDENGSLLDEGVVGIQDGSVEAVVWNEKIYSDNQAQLGSNNKIIFIGATDAAKPVMANINFENEFSQYGVYCGSLGNKAVIYADRKAVSKKQVYDAFVDAYSQFIIGAGTEYADAQKIEHVRVVEDVGIERRANLLEIVNKGIDSLNKGINVVRRLPKNLKKKGAEELPLPENEERIIVNSAGSEPEEKGLIPEAHEKQISLVDTALQALKLYVWPMEIVQQVSLGLVKVKSSKEILDQQYRCAVVAYYMTRLAKFME